MKKQERNATTSELLSDLQEYMKMVGIAGANRGWYDYIEELKKKEDEETPVKCKHGLHRFHRKPETVTETVQPSSEMKRALKDTGRRVEDMGETFRKTKYKWSCVNCSFNTKWLTEEEFRLKYPEKEWHDG